MKTLELSLAEIGKTYHNDLDLDEYPYIVMSGDITSGDLAVIDCTWNIETVMSITQGDLSGYEGPYVILIPWDDEINYHEVEVKKINQYEEAFSDCFDVPVSKAYAYKLEGDKLVIAQEKEEDVNDARK